MLATLCVTETISWGVLYYAFPVMAVDISRETGWSMTELTGAFSIGRIGYPALARHATVRSRTTLVLLATAATTALLAVTTSAIMVITVAVLAGVARGLLTLVQATAISDRWGTARYARLTGLLSAPITAAVAVAPWAGAALADMVGDYPTAFLLLAVLGLVGVAFAGASVPDPQRPAG